MLNTDQILRILNESALLLRHDVNMADLRGRELSNRNYAASEAEEWIRDLIETGNNVRVLFLEYQLEKAELIRFTRELDFPLLFLRSEGNTVIPQILVTRDRGSEVYSFFERDNEVVKMTASDALSWLPDGAQVKFYAITAYDHLVSEPSLDESGEHKHLSPPARLFKLLGAERKEILYILFYAIVVGLLSLVLPLGISTTVELVSGGVFFSSIYLLIGLIIFGVLVGGILQIIQISMVENLQRRIFTKAAYEFAYRMPRVRSEALHGQYAPEIVNRFFDVIIIQKGLPKLLIDLSAATLQIFFGLVLISLYHPFFVFFGITLVGVLILIFMLTGPKGMMSSIQESKYKYKVVYWLQELGRAINSFKVIGNTNLPIRKTDANVNNYLKYRKSHFSVLITQYSYILFFKTGVTAALLIMGTILVVDRQITLGQFVAAEVIIILILASVERIITYMDVIYDMLTAVDKIGHVTDLSLERSGGVDLPASILTKPLAVEIKNLKYKYPGANDYMLKGVSLSVQSGDHVCISGPGSAGKSTLTQVVAGLQNQFEGIVTIGGFSIRDLDLTNLRDKISKNISAEDLFDGTLLENITVGKIGTTVKDAIDALERVELTDWVNQLPEGLNTPIISGGKGLPSSVTQRLILARCIAERPRLVVLQDFFFGMQRSDKQKLIAMLVDKENPWTLLSVSNDPLIMEACDRIVVLDQGKVRAEGTFRELMDKNLLTDCLE
ncbi:MAG TPA: xenobiotic-transporting ATPase [Cytophagales bacterium]|nr:xenobiotic-transporting ATPase [Cytophagales bacterium]